MTEYNPGAWDALLKLKGIFVYDLQDELESAGITVPPRTLLRWRQDGSMPPGFLVDVCNHFHFPISFFTRVKGNHEDRNYRIISDEDWKPIILNTSNIVKYASSGTNVKRKKLIDDIGCSNGTYDALRKYPQAPLPQKMKFTDLLTYINNVKMYPGDVIEGGNELFLFEEDVTPFYNHDALILHDKKYSSPKPETPFAADDMNELVTQMALELQWYKKRVQELEEIIRNGWNPT